MTYTVCGYNESGYPSKLPIQENYYITESYTEAKRVLTQLSQESPQFPEFFIRDERGKVLKRVKAIPALPLLPDKPKQPTTKYIVYGYDAECRHAPAFRYATHTKRIDAQRDLMTLAFEGVLYPYYCVQRNDGKLLASEKALMSYRSIGK